MNRVLLPAFLLLLCSAAVAQPDPDAPGMAVNPGPVEFARPAPAPQHETPEDAARKFVSDVSQELFEPSLSFDVAGARVGFFGPDDFEWAFKNLPTLRALNTTKIERVHFETQTENEATVALSLRPQRVVNGRVEGQGEVSSVSLPLRREKNPLVPGLGALKYAWRVVPPSIDEVLAKPLLETPPLQLAAALATRDPRLLPAIRQYRGLSQLKQLGLGALQFTQDYDEFYAFDDAAHERALRPYLKDDSLYTIAGTKDQKWHFNDNLSTLPLAKLNEPARTVLFYDGEAPTSDKLNFRFGDKTMIGFADGHCKALSKDELKDLIWKP